MKKIFLLIICLLLVGCGSIEKYSKEWLLKEREHFFNFLKTNEITDLKKLDNGLYYKVDGISFAEEYTNEELSIISISKMSKDTRIDDIFEYIGIEYCKGDSYRISKAINDTGDYTFYDIGKCSVSKQTNGVYSYLVKMG